MSYFRGCLFVAFMGSVTLLLALVCLPLAYLGPDYAGRINKLWSKIMLGALHLMCGVKINVEGREYIPQGPAIVAANHQSMWETIALYALLPKAAMVFKEELLRVPIYGWWGVRAGNIVLDRNAGSKAIRHLKKSAQARLADGAQIVIFPEGTRANAGRMLPIQPGVAALYLMADVQCTPVVHNSGRLWLSPGPAKIPGVVTLRFLPPIEKGLNRKDFVARLQKDMSAAFTEIDAGDRAAKKGLA